MPSTLLKLSSLITDSIKSFDKHGKPITFTYKGEEEFKTTLGGIISILIRLILTFYAYLMFRIMYERKDTSKSINTVVKDILHDSETIELNSTEFAFAFSIVDYSDPSFNFTTATDYISVSINQHSKSSGVLTSTPISFSKCGSRFKYPNQTQVEELQINDFYCPDSDAFEVLGNTFSKEYKYFELKIDKCFLGGCQSDADINDKINSLTIDMVVANTYFDFDDYEQPVKTFIDDRFWISLMGGFKKSKWIYLRQNEAEVADDFFRYQPGGSEKEFVSIGRIDDKLASDTDNNALTFRFVKDPSSESYERSVFSLLDVFGNIGGFNEVLEVTGALFVGLFSEHLFTFSIISSLYQVEKPTKRSVNKQSKNQIHPDPATSPNDISRTFDHSRKLESQISDNRFVTRNHEVSQDGLNQHSPVFTIKEKANEAMNKRVKYDWKISDFVFTWFTQWWCCCCCKSKHKQKLDYRNRRKLMKQGSEKYLQDFDAIKFSRNMRKLNTLMISLMSEHQRKLAKYHKSGLLKLTSSSEPEKDSLDEILPRMNEKDKHREPHLKQVEKIMRKYEDAIPPQDLQILNSVIHVKPLKEFELQNICDHNLNSDRNYKATEIDDIYSKEESKSKSPFQQEMKQFKTGNSRNTTMTK